jgi:hypothetical protein
MGSQSSKIRNNTGLRPDLKSILLGLDGNLGVKQGTVWYVDAVDGLDGNDGLSWERPLLTMNEAFQTDRITSGDTILVRGKIQEQINTPAQVFDITVIGAANRPRHADVTPVDPDGRTHGATWAPAASPTATVPNLTVRNQGWTFVNLLFDGPSDDGCVELYADAGAGNDERDGSHASFIGCKFANGQDGIRDVGGTTNVLVSNCQFNNLTNAIITISTGVRVPQYWTIEDSVFQNNTNHIRISNNYGVIRNNLFGKFTTTSIKTTEVSSQGGDNVIAFNALGGTYSIAGGYTGASSDQWFNDTIASDPA